MLKKLILIPVLIFTSATCVWADSLAGLSAADVDGLAAVAPLEHPQPPAKLIVDAPLPGPLKKGFVFIQYRTENFRIEPVFGEAALSVTPRIGHLHLIVDDNPWHWADTSGEPIILVGLPAGKHKLTILLADPIHRPIAGQTLEFTVPPHAPISNRVP